MRIRTVKPEFFTHSGLFDAEKETGLPLRIAFIGLWCACDREGRFKWEPRRLGVMILPYDGLDFSRALDALTTRGFVVKYRVGTEWFGSVPSFTKHQAINNRESASVLPDISEAEEVISQAPTRAPRVNDTCATPLMHAPAEGKGKEGNMERKDIPPADAGSLAGAQEVRLGDKESSKPKAKPQPSERGLKFAVWFNTLLPETMHKVKNWEQNWGVMYDQMVGLDKRSDSDIRDVCEWGRQDDFWRKNFLSPAKLREKDSNGIQFFDRIMEAMTADKSRVPLNPSATKSNNRYGLPPGYKIIGRDGKVTETIH